MKQDFLSLYDESFDDVYRYVYYKIGNKWDADDVVSDIFRRAFEKYHMVKGSPRAWLFVIARNAIADHYRNKKQIAVNDDDLNMLLSSDETIRNSDDIIEEKDTMDCLKQALSYLNEEELEVIKLKYFSNLKYREIGEITGRSEDYIKVRANRIINKLRVIIHKCLEG